MFCYCIVCLFLSCCISCFFSVLFACGVNTYYNIVILRMVILSLAVILSTHPSLMAFAGLVPPPTNSNRPPPGSRMFVRLDLDCLPNAPDLNECTEESAMVETCESQQPTVVECFNGTCGASHEQN